MNLFAVRQLRFWLATEWYYWKIQILFFKTLVKKILSKKLVGDWHLKLFISSSKSVFTNKLYYGSNPRNMFLKLTWSEWTGSLLVQALTFQPPFMKIVKVGFA